MKNPSTIKAKRNPKLSPVLRSTQQNRAGDRPQRLGVLQGPVPLPARRALAAGAPSLSETLAGAISPERAPSPLPEPARLYSPFPIHLRTEAPIQTRPAWPIDISRSSEKSKLEFVKQNGGVQPVAWLFTSNTSYAKNGLMKRKKTAGVWRLPPETIKEAPQGAIDRVPTGNGPSVVSAGRLVHCRMNSRCSWNKPRPCPARYARTCHARADHMIIRNGRQSRASTRSAFTVPGCCHLTATTKDRNRFLFREFPWRPIAGSDREAFPVVDGFPAPRGRLVLQFAAASAAQIESNIASSCVAPRRTEGNSRVCAKSKLAPHPISGCTRTRYRGQRAIASAANPAGIRTDPAAIHGATACRQRA